MMNEDVPYEAILKYIKRDRDRYKAKAEKLEQDVRSLEEELRKFDKKEAGFQNTIQQLRDQLAVYRNEVKAARSDIRQSTVYRNLEQSLREKTVRCQLLEVENKGLKYQLKKLTPEKETENPKRKKFLIF